VCSLTGNWLDDNDNEATIVQTGLALLATAVTPVGWATAPGELSADGSSLWFQFSPGNNLTAVVSSACTELRFSTGTVWRLSQPLANVTVVHAIFMTHLDIGEWGGEVSAGAK
jgi:hypothetical protein